MKRLLLLSGPMGVGKSSIAKELKEAWSFSSISSGSYLRAMAGSTDRQMLQDLGDRLDRETDFGWIVDKVARPAVEEAPTVDSWLLDAVRKVRQVEHFRLTFGGCVRHLHLVAPEDVLLRRYIKRTPFGEAEYALACSHPNEIESRSLISCADLVLDTSVETPRQIAGLLMHDWVEQ